MGIGVERILLFGSYASGQAREDSDVDLVVISADWEGLCERERLEVLGVAAARILQPIQAQGFTPEELSSGALSQFWREVVERHAVDVTSERGGR